jgi:hypothetical protein
MAYPKAKMKAVAKEHLLVSAHSEQEIYQTKVYLYGP